MPWLKTVGMGNLRGLQNPVRLVKSIYFSGWSSFESRDNNWGNYWGSQLLIKSRTFELVVREVIVQLPELLSEITIWLPANLPSSRLASWAGYYRWRVGFLGWLLQVGGQSPIFRYAPAFCLFVYSVSQAKGLRLMHCTHGQDSTEDGKLTACSANSEKKEDGIWDNENE